ncbi:MAG TPA: alpha-hydroxy acid oxidase [Acidimicrobiia bacterium]|nr:alpha-hydroxy acid oxidase [Acidimicrobiia bacterium]
MQRQAPRWRELRQLIRVKPPRLGRAARVAEAATIWDLRRLARRRAPRAVFDYVDGAAENEVTLRRSRQAYARVEFVPSVLRDVSRVDMTTTILGKPSALPLVLSPTGFTRMMHAAGETAVAKAAGRAGIPYALSTLGTTAVDDLAKAAAGTELWFQLYVWRDRGFSLDLLDRARAAGYETLILTVDTPVAGARLRDVYNGLTIPPELSLSTVLDGALHPAWWWDLLTTAPLEFASLRSSGGTVAELIDKVFDPSVGFDDVAWLKENWAGPVVVKGIQSRADAVTAVERGADAVIVSNHGGRQLDRSPTTLEVLPEVVDAVGEAAEVYVDGGITSGSDIAAAVSFGARAAMVGRAYLYGLMAGGEAGVDRALDILRTELKRTMQLLGVTGAAELDASRVRLRAN